MICLKNWCARQECVITSYSIHYTKLYEFGLFASVTALNLSGLAQPYPSIMINVVKGLLILFVVVNDCCKIFRITSYNVCYTKLLRVSITYSLLLRSTASVKLPLVISIISVGINTILNYLLIFGHFGMPRLWVKGAAIATLIASYNFV